MKLSEAIEGFWLEKKLHFSRKSVDGYSRIFDRFLAFLGDKELEAIRSNDIRQFLNDLYLNQNQSKCSLQKYWGVLSSLWTWAEKELSVPHIIRGYVTKPRFTRRIIKPFGKDEVSRLIEAAEYEKEWITRNGNVTRSRRATASRERAIMLTLVDTGLRASELCDLRFEDYDAVRGRLLVRHGKGDKERFVVFGKRTAQAISDYLLERGELKPSAPLFATRTGSHLVRENLRNLLRGLADCAGVSDVHPHRFRHTFAITFLRNGGKMLVLKELLGHAKLDMIMTYVAIAEQDLDHSVRCSPADNWAL